MKLGEVVDVLDSMRVPVNAEERTKRVGNVPYYGANGQQGWIDRALFDEPLILAAEDGGNFDEFATRPIAYRVDGPSWVNNHAHILRAIEGTDQSFVFWSLVHKDIRRYIAGGTRAKLTQAELRSIDLHHPFLPEQRQIAAILDTIDDAIRKTEQIIDKLTQVKQGLLHDLLTRGVDDNGELRDPERRPEQFKDSPLGRIPKGWRATTVGESLADGTLIAVQDGNHGEAHPKRDDFVTEGVPFVMANNLRDGRVDVASCYKITREHYASLRVGFAAPGDVLLSHKGTMGETALVDEHLIETMLTPQVTYYRANPRALLPKYLVWWFSGSSFQSQLAALSVQSTRSFLSITGQRQLRLAVPAVSEQPEIGIRLGLLSDRLVAERRDVEKLRLLKAGLMEDLLTGRVRVTKLLESAAE